MKVLVISISEGQEISQWRWWPENCYPICLHWEMFTHITAHWPPKKVIDGLTRITANHPLPFLFLLGLFTRMCSHHRASPSMIYSHHHEFFCSVETRPIRISISIPFITPDFINQLQWIGVFLKLQKCSNRINVELNIGIICKVPLSTWIIEVGIEILA